jgi:hypothetical protein
MGGIYLFSHLARRRYGLHVEKVRAGFPDCIAYRQGKRVRIEFEFRSHNFCTHGHCLTDCDWIVCWIHDWPGVPSHIRVVELRKEFGLGFNVWFQPIQPKYALNAAEAALHARKHEFDLNHGGTPEENQAIEDALRALGVLQTDLATWLGSKRAS